MLTPVCFPLRPGINVYDMLMREVVVTTPEVIALLEERFEQEPLPPLLFTGGDGAQATEEDGSATATAAEA